MSDKLVPDPFGFLDDITDKEAVTDAFKSLPSKTYGAKPTGKATLRGTPKAEPGYVPCPVRGSFHAKAVLKALGGYFDWDQKYWFVPVAQRDKAFAACKEAERRNTDLVAQEVTSLLEEDAVTTLGTCWECGGPLGEYIKNVAGATWNNSPQKLKVGALPEEAYCGCVERGDTHRRHRPDFRKGRLRDDEW